MAKVHPRDWWELCTAARLLPDCGQPIAEYAARAGITVERAQYLYDAWRYQPHLCSIRVYHQFARHYRCPKGLEHEGCCPGECDRARQARAAWLVRTGQPPDQIAGPGQVGKEDTMTNKRAPQDFLTMDWEEEQAEPFDVDSIGGDGGWVRRLNIAAAWAAQHYGISLPEARGRLWGYGDFVPRVRQIERAMQAQGQ